MRIDFEKMPDNARLWIYQADRDLSELDSNKIKEKLEPFLESWAAHGQELITAYTLKYNRFLMIAVDQESIPPSGCSIDASVRVIQDVQNQLNLDFFNRMDICFKNERGEVESLKMNDFRKMLKEINHPEKLLVFNNLIQSKSELDAWEVEAQNSWHKQWL